MTQKQLNTKWGSKSVHDVLFLYSGDDTITGAEELKFSPELLKDIGSVNEDLYNKGLKKYLNKFKSAKD